MRVINLKSAVLIWGVLALVLWACSSKEPADHETNGAAGAGAFNNPSTAAGGDSGGGAGAAGTLSSGTCAEGVANTSPVTPTVWLVLDGSGSMQEDFSGETRWDALRAALMDDGGVIATLEDHVRFGMVLYSGIDNDRNNNRDNDDNVQPPPEPAVPMECVELVVVEPALSNYGAIEAQFPDNELGGWTPTDRALEHVIDTLPITATLSPDASNDPVYVVLATDGAPNDRCMGDSGQGGGQGGSEFDPVTAQRVLDQVGRGVSMGMKLLVISLAGGDNDLQNHLEEVSELSATGHAPFVPSTRDELITTLQQVIGGAGCQIALEGNVALEQACTGEVTLGGAPLPCNDDNGFRLIDERTVQLVGDACSTFLNGDALVSAVFPCGVYRPD